MCGFIRVDGKAYRFMGIAPEVPDAAEQTSLKVRATQSVYHFRAGGVNLAVTFTAPLLLDDLELLSRPAQYLTFEAASADGATHEVQIYFDATAEWAVNKPNQQVEWARSSADGLDAMRIGTRDQKILATKGDDVRIDWGYLYVAAPQGSAATRIASDKLARGAFAQGEPRRAGRRRNAASRQRSLAGVVRHVRSQVGWQAARVAALDRRLRRHPERRVFWQEVARLVAAGRGR